MADYDSNSKEKYDVEQGISSPPGGDHAPIELELGEGKLHQTLKGRHMQMIAIGNTH